LWACLLVLIVNEPSSAHVPKQLQSGHSEKVTFNSAAWLCPIALRAVTACHWLTLTEGKPQLLILYNMGYGLSCLFEANTLEAGPRAVTCPAGDALGISAAVNGVMLTQRYTIILSYVETRGPPHSLALASLTGTHLNQLAHQTQVVRLQRILAYSKAYKEREQLDRSDLAGFSSRGCRTHVAQQAWRWKRNDAAYHGYVQLNSKSAKPAMLALTMLLQAEMHLPTMILGLSACAFSCQT
jgi:hypothetical protein